MNFHHHSSRSKYVPPIAADINTLSLRETLSLSGRGALQDRQYGMLGGKKDARDITIYAAGDLELLKDPCVSIVGTRDVSDAGRARATRLARELVRAGVVVVSGLAKGVDAAAHLSAMSSGGRTISVIGTPLNKAYPAENASLQEEIYRDHLLISPFSESEHVFKANFPKRNRVMAAISDATVIIEASDTSGTLHQAAECQRLGRWLFIAKSVVDDSALVWPKKFIGHPRVAILESVNDVLHRIDSPS